MKLASSLLIAVLLAAPVAAEEQAPASTSTRGPMFWSGLALGVAGVTTSVLGVTVYRVETSSTGNAPANAYRSCLAMKSDPIYASSDCDALKGKNRPMLWSGVAAGALGAVLMIRSRHTSAEISPGAIRIRHTWAW
jgi:hypothetical protein